jgi:hypothetical protein
MHWISKFWSFWSALYNMLQTEDTELQLVLSYRFSFCLLVGQLGLKSSFSNMHIHSHKWFLMVHNAFVKLGEKCIIYVSVLDMSWYWFPYSHTFAVYLCTLWSLFSPNLLAIGLKYLGDATSTTQDPGISWSNRGKCSYRNEDCVLTMVSSLLCNL